MAAATITLATTTGSGLSNNPTLSVPASIAAGDYVLAVVQVKNASGTISSGFSGWTLLDTYSGTNFKTFVYGIIATGSMSNFAVTFGGFYIFASAIYRATNWRGTSDPEFVRSNGSSSSADPASLTSAGGSEENRWLAIETNNGNKSVSAYPTGYSDNQTNTASQGPNSDSCRIGTASKAATAATDNPAAFTLSGSDEWVAYTFVFRPVSSSISTTPGTLVALSVNPTVVLGSLSVTPTPSYLVVLSVDPTIGTATFVTPTAAYLIAASVDPTTVLGSQIIIPSSLYLVTTSGAPEVIIGSVAITPTPSYLIPVSVNPTVRLGSLAVTPTSIYLIAASVDPTVGFSSLLYTPTPAFLVTASNGPAILFNVEQFALMLLNLDYA